jgi:hypothetical protein
MTNFDLKNDIFSTIINWLQENNHVSSLKEIKRFERIGIEGWFKVEIVAALGKKVTDLKNVGSDVLLKNGQSIELKAATDFNISYFKNGAIKYNCPCLFLGFPSDNQNISSLTDENVKLVAHKKLNDGDKDWIIGIIVPK